MLVNNDKYKNKRRSLGFTNNELTRNVFRMIDTFFRFGISFNIFLLL